jgi:hypothetical protein
VYLPSFYLLKFLCLIVHPSLVRTDAGLINNALLAESFLNCQLNQATAALPYVPPLLWKYVPIWPVLILATKAGILGGRFW